MSPTVVCLDAADTLFTERENRSALYAQGFAHFGVAVTEESLAAWMPVVHDELPARMNDQPRYSRTWFRAFVGKLLERAGESRDPEPLRAHLEELFTNPSHYVVYPDTFPALDDLLQAGHRLAVVSNWSDRLEGLLANLGLLNYFEVLAVSAVVGVDKPDPALFHHALARLDVLPGDALHVGDDPLNDLDGARSAGLGALLLDRSDTPQVATHVITSLMELPQRLREL